MSLNTYFDRQNKTQRGESAPVFTVMGSRGIVLSLVVFNKMENRESQEGPEGGLPKEDSTPEGGPQRRRERMEVRPGIIAPVTWVHVDMTRFDLDVRRHDQL